MTPGRLIVCPTPIGNLEDVTLRVLSALREADVVACEDTRRTRVLLERYGVSAKLVSYHEHNERARATALVERMQKGDVVALVSDAGTPLVSDPGFVLVRAAPEPLVEVTAETPAQLARLAWHLGNRHLPTRIEAGRLLIRDDHVIVEMLRGLGAAVRQVSEPFDPEGGAYGEHNRQPSHPHGHHHDHHHH